MFARKFLIVCAVLLLGIAWMCSPPKEEAATVPDAGSVAVTESFPSPLATTQGGLPFPGTWDARLEAGCPDAFIFVLLVDPDQELGARMAREIGGDGDLNALLAPLAPLTIDVGQEVERFEELFGEPGALGLAIVDYRGRVVALSAGYHAPSAAQRWLMHCLRWIQPIGRLFERRELTSSEHAQLAELLAFNGCSRTSAEHFEEALATYAGDAVGQRWLHASVARLAVLEGDCDGARMHLEQAQLAGEEGQAASPDDRRLQSLVDHMRLTTGLLRGEEAEYSVAIELVQGLVRDVTGATPRALPTGDRELAYARCGELLSLAGRSAEALIALREFVAACPNSIYRTRAEVLMAGLLDPLPNHQD